MEILARMRPIKMTRMVILNKLFLHCKQALAEYSLYIQYDSTGLAAAVTKQHK